MGWLARSRRLPAVSFRFGQPDPNPLIANGPDLSTNPGNRMQALADDFHRIVASAWRNRLFACFQPVDEFEKGSRGRGEAGGPAGSVSGALPV